MSRAPDPAEVARFLRRNPDFLARNPELYRHLVPAERPHGEAMADHMASMLSRARSDAADARARAEALLDCERGGADLAARVRVCVLALLDEDRIGDWVEDLLPGLLGIDAASLRTEGGALPAGMVAALLGSTSVALDNDAAVDADHRRALHGAASGLARHAAYVRVPSPGAACVLALACRDRAVARGATAFEALAFLGAAIGACLGRDARTRLRLVRSR